MIILGLLDRQIEFCSWLWKAWETVCVVSYFIGDLVLAQTDGARLYGIVC